MSYVAAAVVRGKDGWEATELDLAGVADVEEVADRLRDVDPYADVALLFVEADDTYLTIMRLDQEEDLRLFGSDAAFAHESRLGALLLGDLDVPAVELDQALAGIDAEVGTGDNTKGDAEDDAEADAEDDAEVADGTDQPGGDANSAAVSTVDPVGDAELLSDLGVPGHRLVAWCARDGMLPADVTSDIAHAIGCGDEVDELRDP